MLYWATATGLLGFTEAEFWASTVAKVVARLYVHDDRERKRATVGALNASAAFSQGGGKVSPTLILDGLWPRQQKSVTVTPDLDDGAQADWQDLKAQLKSRTKRVTRYTYARRQRDTT